MKPNDGVDEEEDDDDNDGADACGGGEGGEEGDPVSTSFLSETTFNVMKTRDEGEDEEDEEEEERRNFDDDIGASLKKLTAVESLFFPIADSPSLSTINAIS